MDRLHQVCSQRHGDCEGCAGRDDDHDDEDDDINADYDGQTAEDLLNQHTEMMDEIRAKQDDFTQLKTFGQKMYSRQPSQVRR